MFDMGIRKEKQVLNTEEAGILPENDRKEVLKLAEDISSIPQDSVGDEGVKRKSSLRFQIKNTY